MEFWIFVAHFKLDFKDFWLNLPTLDSVWIFTHFWTVFGFFGSILDIMAHFNWINRGFLAQFWTILDFRLNFLLFGSSAQFGIFCGHIWLIWTAHEIFSSLHGTQFRFWLIYLDTVDPCFSIYKLEGFGSCKKLQLDNTGHALLISQSEIMNYIIIIKQKSTVPVIFRRKT